MLGRQSNNQGIRAVPAAGPVKIDGDLSDWDFSGRIWSFADLAIRDRYSAETAAMWDKDYFYLAAKFRDPNPLANTVDPNFDPESGWKGDALQLRVMTDWPRWLTFWEFTGEKRGALNLTVWKTAENSRDGVDSRILVSQPGSISLGEGVEMAARADADGRGYVQEIRIPWSILYRQVPTIAAGLTFRMGLEFFWGAAGESVWPVHRYADNLQPGETSREFFWTAKKAWGDVKLLDKGQVEPLRYVADGDKVQGTIPVVAMIPEKAREFTVVIELPEGKRIRNLGAQLNPELYSTSVQDGLRRVEVLWDGRDDQGMMVPAGKYKVRGLSHEGLGADYVMSFFNPGTPPWETGPSGSWGADHGAPQYVAAAGDWTIIAWHFAEGGSGIIGIAPDGLKKWGEKRGVQALAADRESVYFISSSWHLTGNLCRINRNDGTYKPFVIDGKPRPFELPLEDVFGKGAVPGQVVSMASSGQQLALAMTGGKVALLNTSTAQLEKTFDVPDPRAVASGPNGEWYVISGTQLSRINPDNGSLSPIATPGVDLAIQAPSSEENTAPAVAAASEETSISAGTLTVDPQGNIGVFDQGPDHQIKFFTPEGKLAYAVGKQGGRPDRGDFDEQAMSHVSAIATDSQGQTWATEHWENPRRVSVWARDGKLVRDYIGNTGYAGTGAYLHDTDPTLAYYGPVEMKLDLAQRTWKVNRTLWVPGEGENFEIPSRTHAHPQRFSRMVDGKKREFLFSPPFRWSKPYVLFMEGDNGWRPVSAVGLVGQLSGQVEEKDAKVIRQPDGEFAGHDAWDAYFWNDQNGDGKVQFAELAFVPAEKPTKVGEKGKAAIPYLSGWGTRMNPDDLSFVVNGLSRYVPLSYTKEGAPVFGPKSIHKYETAGTGDFVPVPEENTVIALTWEKFFGTKGIYGLDEQTGRELWSYPNPYPGVHGSHRAPMPQPGLVIGPLKILGVAALPENKGHVFGLRGNLGQDFYFTTDGLFISTVFQDGRLPGLALPAKESQLVGAPMETYGGGGEPFTGWFGRQDDGKYRLISGIPRQAAMVLEMKGLDRIQRFNAPELTVDERLIAQAAAANDARALASRAAAVKRQEIARTDRPLPVDGSGKEWKKVPAFTVESPASGLKARAQLAYDDKTLYLAMEVEDPTPWKNEGVDFTRLFKTGDAVDIQLATDSAAPERDQPAKGDLRVVLANLNKEPSAVLMQPVGRAASPTAPKTYTSPVGSKVFDEVRPLTDARVAVVPKTSGYRVEAAIPLADLGLTPQAGAEIRGDIGFISSDATGRINTARTYWSNDATNLVNDEPFEAWLSPRKWGVFSFAK